MLTIQEILTKCRSLEMNLLNVFLVGVFLGSVWDTLHLAKLALLEISTFIP
jgi:hypothetical protein